MGIPNSKVDRPGIIVSREVHVQGMVQSTHQWNYCCLQWKSILHLPPSVCEIHLGIHPITQDIYSQVWSSHNVLVRCTLAKYVPGTLYRVSETEKSVTVWCGDGGNCPFRHMVIHDVAMNIHRPSVGLDTVIWNLTSAIMKEVMNL